MQQAWTEFLGRPGSGHGVQIYTDAEELADSVVAYATAGFERGEPAILVATSPHLDVFRERLGAIGWHPSSLEEQSLLVCADAEATLDSLIVDGSVSAARFEEVVGSLIDRMAGASGRHTRAFGEMVDVLCERGQVEEAIALEAIWTRAAERRNFSLLCGYCLDVFDRTSQLQTLPQVCAHHSHILPARKYARFARSVDCALDEVLGAREAGRIYMLVGRQIQEDRIPAAQLILMWVSRNMPILAERILESARTHYLASAA